jgi:hypothetical protein
VRGGVPGPENQCLVIRDALKRTSAPRKWKTAKQAEEAPKATVPEGGEK